MFKREILRSTVKEKIKRDYEAVSQLKTEEILPEFKKYSLKKPLTQRAPFPYRIPAPLQIPESRLPRTVEYLKPTPTQKAIDLGKLNPLITDRLVRVIECNGPDERIIVMGAMGRKSTKIILTKEEIDDMIKRFSQAAKIPVNEGVFRVVLGNLILSAIVSKIIGSKFLIRKIAPGPVI